MWRALRTGFHSVVAGWKNHPSLRAWVFRFCLATALAITVAWLLQHVDLSNQSNQWLKLNADLQEWRQRVQTQREQTERLQEELVLPPERLKWEARERGMIRRGEVVFQVVLQTSSPKS